jgi:hypothetical protein
MSRANADRCKSGSRADTTNFGKYHHTPPQSRSDTLTDLPFKRLAPTGGVSKFPRSEVTPNGRLHTAARQYYAGKALSH